MNENPIESPFQKNTTSTRYKSAPQPVDTLYTVKRKINLEVQNPEIFNKVKVYQKPEADKILEFQMGLPEEDTFKIENEIPTSIILAPVIDNLEKKLLSPELLKYKELMEYVNGVTNAYLFNNMGYQKKFVTFRNQRLSNFKKQFFDDIVTPFLSDLIPGVYVNLYNEESRPELGDSTKSNNFFSEHYRSEAHSHNKMDLFEKLMADFCSSSSLYTSMSLHGIIEKLTDNDVSNCFFQNPFYFDHYLNYTMSPMALNLSYFHYRLTTYNKDNFSKSTLPRCTYISFTGVYSEQEYDIISRYSDSVQLIMLYDASTGGPCFSQQSEYTESDAKHKKGFYMKDNIFFLPIETNGPRKILYPSDFVTIFRSIVLPLIYSFNPEYVVFNHSFIFSDNSNNPFYIDSRSLGKILRALSINSDFKILIYPFKIPARTPEELGKFLDNISADLKKKLTKEDYYFDEKQKKDEDKKVQNQVDQFVARHKYIAEIYGLDYDRKYFRDCYVSAIESISALKRYSKRFIPSVKKPDSILEFGFTEASMINQFNPYLMKTLSQWTKIYKHHVHVSIFETSLNQMTKLVSSQLMSQMMNSNKKFLGNLDFTKNVTIKNTTLSERLEDYYLKDFRSKILVWIHDTFVYLNLAPGYSKMWKTDQEQRNFFLSKKSQCYFKYAPDSPIEIFIFNATELKKDESLNIYQN